MFPILTKPSTLDYRPRTLKAGTRRLKPGVSLYFGLTTALEASRSAARLSSGLAHHFPAEAAVHPVDLAVALHVDKIVAAAGFDSAFASPP